MGRRITGVFVAVALAAFALAPASVAAGKKAGPRTQYLNWAGECGGSGYLSLKPVPNENDCALFFPELGNSYYFTGAEGMPFSLDATKAITLDFNLSTIASAAAEFEAVLTATVGGSQVDVAAATTTVTAAGPGATPVHFDLEPPASLHNKKVSSLTVTVNWNSGFTYSSMTLGDAGSKLVAYATK